MTAHPFPRCEAGESRPEFMHYSNKFTPPAAVLCSHCEGKVKTGTMLFVNAGVQVSHSICARHYAEQVGTVRKPFPAGGSANSNRSEPKQRAEADGGETFCGTVIDDVRAHSASGALSIQPAP